MFFLTKFCIEIEKLNLKNFFSSIQRLSFEDLVEKLSGFVVTFDVVQENFIVNLFITAVFLCSDTLRIQLQTLDTLVKKNAGFQLPLILFKLSKTSCSELQLKLLHSLPLTAVVKVNECFTLSYSYFI